MVIEDGTFQLSLPQLELNDEENSNSDEYDVADSQISMFL